MVGRGSQTSRPFTSADVELIRTILDGYGVKKMGKQQFHEVIKLFESIDGLEFVPDKHLYFLFKWFAGSVIRRMFNVSSIEISMKIYLEMKKRGDLDKILILKAIRDKTTGQVPSFVQDPVASQKLMQEYLTLDSKSQDESNLIARKIISREEFNDLIKELVVDKPEIFDYYCNILVSLSNLNCYDFDIYESMKIIISGILEMAKTKQIPITGIVHEKMFHIFWAYRRLNIADKDFYTKIWDMFKSTMALSDQNQNLRLIWMASAHY